MSRIIIKNIPKIFNEQQIAQHFSPVDTITDVRVMRTPDGQSRRFAFVGFMDPDTAERAKKQYDKTYVGASLVRVEVAEIKGGKKGSERERTREKEKRNKQADKQDEEETSEVKGKDMKKFERSRKRVQKEALKSWDDLIVPKTHDQHDFQQQPQPKQAQKQPQPYPKEFETEMPVRTPSNKPPKIKAPRLSQRNKQFVSKPLQVDTSRLYVTNLPYTLDQQTIRGTFSRFGRVNKVKMPLVQEGKNKGYCFVHYLKPEEALRAYSTLNNTVVFGRIIHVQPALEDIGSMIAQGKEQAHQEKIKELYGDPAEDKTAFKKKKKKEMRERLHDETSWNTLFLNPNTLLERMAKKLHTTKSDILLSEGLATKVALAESEVILETKEWLRANGVSLDFIEQDRKSCLRSKDTLLVKNLNYRTEQRDLQELFGFYGVVSQILLAPNRAIAIVRFSSGSFAENAVRNLQQHKFKNSFIFLEFAPEGMLGEEEVAEMEKEREREERQEEELSKVVYVKNLNFETEAASLESFFLKAGYNVVSAKVVRSGEGRSMGYGFVEFEAKEAAMKAIRQMNNQLLDGHRLLLSISKPKKSANHEKLLKIKQEAAKGGEVASAKLSVKNLAFQATKQELRQLFGEFGGVKRVRLPKKMDGGHRGFAFLEFETAADAAVAKEALGSVHLYGRRLVIEYEKGSSS